MISQKRSYRETLKLVFPRLYAALLAIVVGIPSICFVGGFCYFIYRVFTVQMWLALVGYCVFAILLKCLFELYRKLRYVAKARYLPIIAEEIKQCGLTKVSDYIYEMAKYVAWRNGIVEYAYSIMMLPFILIKEAFRDPYDDPAGFTCLFDAQELYGEVQKVIKDYYDEDIPYYDLGVFLWGACAFPDKKEKMQAFFDTEQRNHLICRKKLYDYMK